MARPIVVDLFCGVGGMSLGFQQAGFDVCAAVDSNPISAAGHKLNFPKCVMIETDILKVTGDSIRTKSGIGRRVIDVVVGGPPCQGFSVGGLRKAGDPRSKLILEFARLVAELRPRYFVMENVAGLLGARSKTLRDRFSRTIEQAGYTLVLPIKILDASDYGVPQSRKRVFILGARKGDPLPTYPSKVRRKVSVWQAIGDLAEVDQRRTNEEDVYDGPFGRPSAYALKLRTRKSAKISGFVKTAHSLPVIARFASTNPGTREPVSRFLRLHKAGLSCTLRAGTGPENGSFMAPRPIHPTFSRCVYAREAARLQSFPDWFEFDSRLWHAFRQIGNSVPPALAFAVAAELLKACSASKRAQDAKRAA